MDLKKSEFVFNNDIIFRQIQDDKQGYAMVIAHNTKSGEVFEFNDVGSDIFIMLKDGFNMAQIIDCLTAEYAVTHDEIYEDVVLILQRLLDLSVISLQK